MSKLYCEITESARRTIPTARAHCAATVRVKNWRFAVETRMIDAGGGQADRVRVAIVNLDTGDEHVIANGTIGTLIFAESLAPAL